MKKPIRLTESDLHRIVKEAVNRILKEEEYRIPTGGMDVYAYDYDQALKTANSLEDWDSMMADREKHRDVSSYNGILNHPQRTQSYGSLGASLYVNPKLHGINDDDNILDSLEKDAEYRKKQHGFPF